MIRYAIPAIAIAAVGATASAPAQAVEVRIDAQGPVVELQISEQVLGDPDKAMVGAGVTTRASTAVEAMRLNATQMESVLARLRQLGVPDARVQTAGITLNPQYDYRNDQPPRFLGYDASNTVSIELRELDRVGPALDALVAAGATNLNGPAWGIIEDAPLRAQARANAFRTATAQAGEYARMAGYSAARLLAVEEQLGGQQPMYDMMQRAPRAVAAEAKTPTRPGQVATQVTLTVKFELTR